MKKCIATLFALCLATPLTAQELPKVTLGMSGWTGFAPLTLAKDAGIFNDGTDTCGPCFDQRCIRLDLDCLAHLPYFQHHIDRWTAVDLKHNSGLHEGVKSGQRYFQPIGSDRQIGQYVGTGLVRNRGS